MQLEEWHGRLLRDTYLAGAPYPSGAVVPYAVALLCPLMHLFMHKGHGSGTTGIEKNRDTASSVQ